MTEQETIARERLRAGSLTSIPRKVRLVQGVRAKSGPTMALPKSRAKASAPPMRNPGCAICALQPLADEFHQFAANAAQLDFQPNIKPTTMTPASAAVLPKVKLFCTSLPM